METTVMSEEFETQPFSKGKLVTGWMIYEKRDTNVLTTLGIATVFVYAGENAKDKAKMYDGPNMQKVMECYNLTLDKQSQMNEHRAHHYEPVVVT